MSRARSMDHLNHLGDICNNRYFIFQIKRKLRLRPRQMMLPRKLLYNKIIAIFSTAEKTYFHSKTIYEKIYREIIIHVVPPHLVEKNHFLLTSRNISLPTRMFQKLALNIPQNIIFLYKRYQQLQTYMKILPLPKGQQEK